MDGARSREAQEDLLNLSARAVVERIRTGEVRAEVYLSRLIAQCKAHAELNTIAAIDEARVHVFRSHAIDAIAVPTVPVPAIALNPDDPMGLWTIEVNGKAMSVGNVLARGTFLAPRVGAPSLTLPVGLRRGLPVGLQLDGLPGDDSKLLGIGMAVEEVIGSIPPPPIR